MAHKHRFIVFEGIEGCGKSTQIRLLAERLTAADGVPPLVLREPGGTEISERVRNILKDARYLGVMQSETELLLMNAARAQLVRETIRPALARGRTIICDRYYYSTLAYQGYGRQLPLDSLETITRYAVGETEPDIVFLLDIPLALSWERIAHRNAELRTQGVEVQDRFELSGDTFYSRVYEGFQTLARTIPTFRKVDATRSPELIAEEIWEVVK